MRLSEPAGSGRERTELTTVAALREATISATAVEAALLEHPQVLDAIVVGVPHPCDGEHVGAEVARVQRRRASPA